MAKLYRSAVTGEFVTKETVEDDPSTTETQTKDGGSTKSARSAKTDEFVTEAYAQRNPSTTEQGD